MATFPAHYAAIRTEAQRIRWPKKFRRDLTFHDRRFLKDLPESEPFVWILREHGTHLVCPLRWKAKHSLAELLVVLNTLRTEFSDEKRAYLWDGRFLIHLSHEALIERVTALWDATP